MILTGWLLFSIVELIVVHMSSFYLAVYITIQSNSGASVLGLIIPILITRKYFHHYTTLNYKKNKGS